MAGKIFYQEQAGSDALSDATFYRLFATQDLDCEIYGHHFEIHELQAIAEATGAELIQVAGQPGEKDSNPFQHEPRTLEMLLIEAAGKAQFLIDAEDADEEELLSMFTRGEREMLIMLLTRFVEDGPPKYWIS
jgi:hypothetical protein